MELQDIFWGSYYGSAVPINSAFNGCLTVLKANKPEAYSTLKYYIFMPGNGLSTRLFALQITIKDENGK